MPESVAGLTVQTCSPGLDCDFVLSSLPTNVAEKVELELAKSGMPVISNASSHRMKADVPVADSRDQSGSSGCTDSPEAAHRGKGISSSPIPIARRSDWYFRSPHFTGSSEWRR